MVLGKSKFWSLYADDVVMIAESEAEIKEYI